MVSVPRLQSISNERSHRSTGKGQFERRDLFKGKTHFVLGFPPAPAVKPDRHHHVARSEDGRLFYDNQWYCRGQAVCINKKDEYPTRWVPESILTTRRRKRLQF